MGQFVAVEIARKHRRRVLRELAFALIALSFASASWSATISGTVFEDRNYGGGAGRSRAASGGVGLPGVVVELYQRNGNSNNYRFLDSTTTNSAGAYSFNTGSFATGTYRVRVVNGTVRSSRGLSCSTCVPVQTFRTDASGGSAVPVTNRVGGENPGLSDADRGSNNQNFSNLSGSGVTPQSYTQVVASWLSLNIAGVDFGFNFNVIVNTRDATNCGPSGNANTYYPCQGSLRQFIINANALGGEGSLAQDGNGLIDGASARLPQGFETSVFMIPNGATNAGQSGYANQLSAGVAEITLAGALPSITGPRTRLDASTQTINIGNTNSGSVGTGGTVGVDNVLLPTIQRPEVQLNCDAAGPVVLSGSEQTLLGFALRQGYIDLAGPNGTARNNLVGMRANGSSADISAAAYGILFSAPGANIQGNFVTVNNSAIRSDGGGSNSTIHFNEVARPSSGHTNTFDGILLINGASNVQIVSNLVRDQAGGAIELGFGASTDLYSNILVSNNTFQNNGFTSGTTPSSEPIGVVSYNYTGTNVVYSRNRIVNNAGAGILIMAASGTIVSQNSFSGNGGVSIDLDPNTRDPNALGALNGVTLNDNGDVDTGPNGLLNAPVITSAVAMGGQLSVAGFARPGSAIELYVAQPDPSGFGEGLMYVGTLVEGSAGDLANSTGSYGPAAINGLAQGSDTTNRFSFSIPLPSGVSTGIVLTSTATLGGQTSEFGGNVVVSSGPSLTHLKSVTVVSDPFNGGLNPKSIPGAVQLYAVRVSNQGSGPVDPDSLVVTDTIPANTAMMLTDAGASGSGPIAFVQGSPSSGLSFTFDSFASTVDDVEFSNDGANTWSYTPTPNADGYDASVTHVRVHLRGAMSANSGTGEPSFELRWRVRVN